LLFLFTLTTEYIIIDVSYATAQLRAAEIADPMDTTFVDALPTIQLSYTAAQTLTSQSYEAPAFKNLVLDSAQIARSDRFEVWSREGLKAGVGIFNIKAVSGILATN
jgi:hypothetical protein